EKDGAIPGKAVIGAVRAGIRHQLGDLAERVSTTLTWDDAILHADLRALLAEVVAYARHREHVFGTWGFARKAGGHFGLSVLFSGPPGTGKTMTASLIGADLGKEVYRIDLSRVVDKYIGETEKNLARLFDQAERAQVILLFDEADSLFSSRTQVKSSNDRYANLEVNYLLQRMEAYSGMSILTTNFDMGLDTAFQRRLRFRISFRMPDAAERERLWRSMVPPEAALEPAIDWRTVAEEFEMAGGNIKNALIRAAVLAAEAGTAIGFDQLYQAALSEFREMGRLA
ncbi:MAG: ATP-binding protein, partial [Deltaproteobacteria bacterium]|nr:ATP-binding protein [Deltaproteobacteria bacterium]